MPVLPAEEVEELLTDFGRGWHGTFVLVPLSLGGRGVRGEGDAVASGSRAPLRRLRVAAKRLTGGRGVNPKDTNFHEKFKGASPAPRKTREISETVPSRQKVL